MKGSLGRESAGTVMGSSVEAVLATTTIGVAATGEPAVRSFTTLREDNARKVSVERSAVAKSVA
jgi:hypothetical protein